MINNCDIANMYATGHRVAVGQKRRPGAVATWQKKSLIVKNFCELNYLSMARFSAVAWASQRVRCAHSCTGLATQSTTHVQYFTGAQVANNCVFTGRSPNCSVFPCNQAVPLSPQIQCSHSHPAHKGHATLLLHCIPPRRPPQFIMKTQAHQALPTPPQGSTAAGQVAACC